ncbi:MAG: Calx-beta domain-containing protein [Actinomycetota bacterium]
MRWRFDVTLSQPLDHPVLVTWQAADGSAHDGGDYYARAGSFRLKKGQTHRRIGVVVRGDRVIEADETFHVVITSVTGAGKRRDGTAFVLDDDGTTGG